MFRYEIINLLIKKNNYKSYLEIGVRNPGDCFDHIDCQVKHGVDPGIEGEFPVTFRMTSDDFFKINESKYDLIFIDGLHLDFQVEKDIINSLKSLNNNGSIMLHDCNPPTEYHARDNYSDVSTPAEGFWNGSVWKAVVKIRSEIDGIYTSVIDSDWGVGLIQKNNHSNKITNYNPYFSYLEFNKNVSYYLNLITPFQFVNQYIVELDEQALTHRNSSSLYSIALSELEKNVTDSNKSSSIELNQNLLLNENYRLQKSLKEKNQEIKELYQRVEEKNQEIEIIKKTSIFKIIKQRFFYKL